MRSWCIRHKARMFVCGLWLLSAGALWSVSGNFGAKAEARQDNPAPAILTEPPVSPTAAPESRTSPSPLPPVTPADSLLLASSTTATSPGKNAQTIEQLVEQLQRLRAKKTDLEHQEKELVAALKEKLKEQQQRLHSLGIDTASPNQAMNQPSLPSGDLGAAASKSLDEPGSLKFEAPKAGGPDKLPSPGRR